MSHLKYYGVYSKDDLILIYETYGDAILKSYRRLDPKDNYLPFETRHLNVFYMKKNESLQDFQKVVELNETDMFLALL